LYVAGRNSPDASIPPSGHNAMNRNSILAALAALVLGMKHAVWIEGETIVQFHGIGPWIINYVNPADDPRNAKKAP
jgi:hypothetical protein